VTATPIPAIVVDPGCDPTTRRVTFEHVGEGSKRLKAVLNQLPSRLAGLLRLSPAEASSAGRLPNCSIDLVDGHVHRQCHSSIGGSAQSSGSLEWSSSGNGACWYITILTQRSDFGSNRVAPKNESLQRRRSIGRTAASIRLSRISAYGRRPVV